MLSSLPSAPQRKKKNQQKHNTKKKPRKAPTHIGTHPSFCCLVWAGARWWDDTASRTHLQSCPTTANSTSLPQQLSHISHCNSERFLPKNHLFLLYSFSNYCSTTAVCCLTLSFQKNSWSHLVFQAVFTKATPPSTQTMRWIVATTGKRYSSLSKAWAHTCSKHVHHHLKPSCLPWASHCMLLLKGKDLINSVADEKYNFRFPKE